MTAARYWDEDNQKWVFVSKSNPLPTDGEGGGAPQTVAWSDVTGKPATFLPTIGTTDTTAKAGSWKPTSADISDASTVGKSVLTATDQAAARTAIGAGTSNLAIGTSGTQAAAGNHTHAAATTSAAGFMAAADKTKLDGITAGAVNGAGAVAAVAAKTQIAALTPIGDPSAADAPAVATLLNAVVAALKA